MRQNMKITVFTYLLLAIIASTSCQKGLLEGGTDSNEIIISVKGNPLTTDVVTKTTAVTSMPSGVYWAGTIGSSSYQSNKWSSSYNSVSSNTISTGYFQTNSPTAYNYYVSNVSMAHTYSGYTVIADGTLTDVIAGVAKASTSIAPSVTLNHIFARTGTIRVSSSTGYTLSNVSVTIKSNSGAGYKGTYNIYSGTWSSVTALSSTTLTDSSDLYLIPGSYTVTVSCTRQIGSTYSQTFGGSTSVTLTAGKINNISISLTGDPAVPINALVDIAPWGSVVVSGTAS